MLVTVIRPSVFAPWQLPMLGSYPPTETGQQGPYLFSSLHFKGMVPWGRYSWVIENTSQSDRVRVYNCKFSKGNTLRRGKLGNHSQILTRTNRKFLWLYWVFSVRHFKRTGVILGSWPWTDGSHAGVCLSLLVYRMHKLFVLRAYSSHQSSLRPSWEGSSEEHDWNLVKERISSSSFLSYRVATNSSLLNFLNPSKSVPFAWET